MPAHYAELDREEMAYIDGGGFTLYTWMVSAPIDFALMSCGATLIFGGMKSSGKFFGKSLAEKFSKSLAPIVVKLVSSVSGGALNLSVGAIGQALFDNAWNFTSLGGIVAFVLDLAVDGRADGIIAKW